MKVFFCCWAGHLVRETYVLMLDSTKEEEGKCCVCWWWIRMNAGGWRGGIVGPVRALGEECCGLGCGVSGGMSLPAKRPFLGGFIHALPWPVVLRQTDRSPRVCKGPGVDDYGWWLEGWHHPPHLNR